MNPADAAPGQRVLYTPPGGRNGKPFRDSDYGTVTSANALYVFVRYDDQPQNTPGRATYAADLTLLRPPPPPPHPEGATA